MMNSEIATSVALGRKLIIVVIDTDPMASTETGGARWDVPVAEASVSARVGAAFEGYRLKLGER